MALVSVVFAALALLHAWVMPPEGPTDATSNLGYAMVLASGQLPTIETPIPSAPPLRARVERDRALGKAYRAKIWTANHPPLYYGLTAIPIAVGSMLDAPALGIVLARAQNILIALAMLWSIHRLAAALFPRDPDIALLAIAWFAAVPLVSMLASAFFNDLLAATLATWCLVHIVAVLRGDLSPKRAFAIGGTAALALSCRVSGVVVLGLGLFAVSYAVWSRRSGLAAWIVLIARVLLPSVLFAAPFFVRNVVLYGEPTGTSRLLTILARKPEDAPLAIVADPDFWMEQLVQLMGASVRSLYLWETNVELPGFTLVAAAVLVLVPVVGLWPAYRRRTAPCDPGPAGGTASIVRWGVVLAVPAAAIAMSVLHESRGGYAHGRYLVAGLPVLSVVFAVGLRALGRVGTAVVLATGWAWTLSVVLPGFCTFFTERSCAAGTLVERETQWISGSICVAVALAVWVSRVVLRRASVLHDVGASASGRRVTR